MKYITVILMLWAAITPLQISAEVSIDSVVLFPKLLLVAI